MSVWNNITRGREQQFGNEINPKKNIFNEFQYQIHSSKTSCNGEDLIGKSKRCTVAGGPSASREQTPLGID
ncbi:hypothetical protein L6452_38137 [Arctium lappa]|uniref:Uncharacterized protein n=1 Tax=Arctium lappa TaxID=4217 RepID=A0ACB8Y5D7_ARCLA|nr:hypothetical protein L6452_38137 [Arctium lappa]